MRYLVLALLPVMAGAQGGAPVEGIVTSSVTHMGLAGVSVSVMATTGRRITYNTTTNADGSFRIGSIDQDGEFKAEFLKRGYRELPPDHPAKRPFHLSAATGPVSLQVELSPHSQLRGRVVDSEGRPVAEAQVELIGTTGNWVMSARTAKDGSFVYLDSLPSPSFVLRAIPPKALPLPLSAEDVPLVWAPTYYPNGADHSQATPIVWRGDVDSDGLEIRLLALPVFRVKGIVLDDSGKAVEGASVKLVFRDEFIPLMIALDQPEAKTVTGNDGGFELSAVRPGEWMLVGEWKRANQSLSGFASGRVSRGDWEGARIELEVPFNVKGSVDMPGTGDGAGGRRGGAVMLAPDNETAVRQVSLAPVGPDGRFEIPDIHAGRYRILPAGTDNGGTYLDSVQFGGREVLGQSVDILDSSQQIQVIYKANGGRVQGMAEHCGVVMVTPKETALQQSSVRVSDCDDRGRFEIGGLRPGDYYAAAYDKRPALTDAAFIAGVVAAGNQVRVEGGQSTLVTLKVTALPEQ
jgi:hypothetical protein